MSWIRQPSPLKRAFGVELDPNLNFKTTS